ncbi:MAG: 5-methylcytosine restriction system specificity protein McrC, partial [Nostoc sp.]
QHPIEISQNRHFSIDILLCDAATGKTIAVLDTKYKAPELAGYTDIHQMISYANTTKCKQAFLIYPKDLPQPLDIKSDQIQVRSLTFSLDDNLDRAGQTFLKNLFIFSESS